MTQLGAGTTTRSQRLSRTYLYLPPGSGCRSCCVARCCKRRFAQDDVIWSASGCGGRKGQIRRSIKAQRAANASQVWRDEEFSDAASAMGGGEKSEDNKAGVQRGELWIRKLRNVAGQPISGRDEQSMGKGGWRRTRPTASSMSVRRSRLDPASPSSSILQPPVLAESQSETVRFAVIDSTVPLGILFQMTTQRSTLGVQPVGPPSASREPPSVHSRECSTGLLESSHNKSTNRTPHHPIFSPPSPLILVP